MKIVFFSFLALALSHNIARADNAREIEGLKKQIVELAWDNIDNENNLPEVRVSMERLLSQLKALKPAVTQEDMLRFSPGSWQQIWSDEASMDPPGAPKRNLRQIYQVVNPAGWGFNFGMREVNGQIITFALGVAASVDGNKQSTEIVSAFSRNTGIEPGENLGNIAQGIHDGRTDFVERKAGTFPKGPIGARGILTIDFVDEDLKIGSAPNVYSGKVEMFVVQRTSVAR